MLSIRGKWRFRDGADNAVRGLRETLRLLDDDPILFCECGAGGDCGDDHALTRR